MTAVAVTGAAGLVGRRVTRLLTEDPAVTLVRALDLAAMPPVAGAEIHRVDVSGPGMVPLLQGCNSVIHLAEDPSRRADAAVAVGILERLLGAAERAGCDHVVVLSSAMVYGAHGDNPVPLTESHPRRPVAALRYATTKAELEDVATAWAERTGRGVALLRPTTALSEQGAGYVARVMRSAMALRPDMVEPPIQFLHHDDLASAVVKVAVEQRSSVLNVAPDGWIAPEVFEDLLAEQLGWPEPLSDLQARVARAVRHRPVDRALAAYISHPWVVANDRLRRTGWKATLSNEEAYVLGTPEPLWHRYSARHRQELALGAGAVVAAGLVGGASLAARRILGR